jgi:hypothetical protein
MSPVYREAYSDTTVAVRSLIDVRTSEETALAKQKIADLEEELRQSKVPSDSTDVAEVKEVKPDKPAVEEVKPSFAELESYYKNLEEQLK